MSQPAHLTIKDIGVAAKLRPGMAGPLDPWLLWTQPLTISEPQLNKFIELAREETLRQIAIEYKLSAQSNLPLRDRLDNLRRNKKRGITNAVKKNLELRAPAVSSVIPSIIMAWLIRTIVAMIVEYIIDQYVMADGDLMGSGYLT